MARVRLGVHVDAVRIAGKRGVETAEALRERATGRGPGPVLRQTAGPDVTYFLVAARHDGPAFRWPPGIRELPPTETLLVPAPHAEGVVMTWLSLPTTDTPYVDRTAILDHLGDVLGWSPTP